MLVDCYKNLHKNKYSVRSCYDGKVCDHADIVLLSSAKFRVQQGGRERVLQEKKKNVHAFVRGNRVDFLNSDHYNWRMAKYNPYKYSSFVDSVSEQPVYTAHYVMLTPHGVYYLDY